MLSVATVDRWRTQVSVSSELTVVLIGVLRSYPHDNGNVGEKKQDASRLGVD